MTHHCTEGPCWPPRDQRPDPSPYSTSWFVGTDEYERRRAAAEQEMARGLSLLRQARGEAPADEICGACGYRRSPDPARGHRVTCLGEAPTWPASPPAAPPPLG